MTKDLKRSELEEEKMTKDKRLEQDQGLKETRVRGRNNQEQGTQTVTKDLKRQELEEEITKNRKE